MADTQNSIEVTGTNEQMFYFQNYLVARRRGEPVKIVQVNPNTAVFSWTGDPTVAVAAQWAVMSGLQVVNPAADGQAQAPASTNDVQYSIEVSGTNAQQFYFYNLMLSLNYRYYDHLGKQPPQPVTPQIVNPTTAIYTWVAYPSVSEAAQWAGYAGLTVVSSQPAASPAVAKV